MSEKEKSFLRLAEFVVAVVGIPSALGYLLSDSIVIAILTGVIVLSIVVGFFYVRRMLKRPPFALTEVEMDLTFHDPHGERVTAVSTQRIRVNQRELPQIRLLNITSDGRIKNIRVDDRPIDEHPDFRQEVESGIIYLVKDFRPPLMRRQSGTAKVALDVIDAFRMNPAGFNHRIAPETEKVRLRVHFNDGRICHSARAFFRYGGMIQEELPAPEISDHGMELVHEVSKPQPGLEYRVEWRWNNSEEEAPTSSS
jgi:hypothetical protein